MDVRNYIIPIFVPHAGCPHQCVFCNQRSISGVQKEISALEVKNKINQYLGTFSPNAHIEVAFFGGSFTGINQEKQAELLKAANEFLLLRKIHGIRVSTRPDYINREALNLLKHFGVNTVELGVQSMDNDVLIKSCRGHSSADVIKASNMIRESDFNLGHQLMIGLPGDTREKDIITAKHLIKLKPKMVRIYPVLVIKGTQLEHMYNNGSYIPLNLENAVEISKEILKLFKKNDINVIRIGLQVTENISLGKDVVAGPFHPAFKDLVESELRLEVLTYSLDNICIIKGQSLIIKSNINEVSVTVGHKRSNLAKLYAKYGFKEIKVLGDPNINKGQVIINVAENTVIMNEKDFILCSTTN